MKVKIINSFTSLLGLVFVLLLTSNSPMMSVNAADGSSSASDSTAEYVPGIDAIQSNYQKGPINSFYIPGNVYSNYVSRLNSTKYFSAPSYAIAGVYPDTYPLYYYQKDLLHLNPDIEQDKIIEDRYYPSLNEQSQYIEFKTISYPACFNIAENVPALPICFDFNLRSLARFYDRNHNADFFSTLAQSSIPFLTIDNEVLISIKYKDSSLYFETNKCVFKFFENPLVTDLVTIKVWINNPGVVKFFNLLRVNDTINNISTDINYTTPISPYATNIMQRLPRIYVNDEITIDQIDITPVFLKSLLSTEKKAIIQIPGILGSYEKTIYGSPSTQSYKLFYKFNGGEKTALNLEYLSKELIGDMLNVTFTYSSDLSASLGQGMLIFVGFDVDLLYQNYFNNTLFPYNLAKFEHFVDHSIQTYKFDAKESIEGFVDFSWTFMWVGPYSLIWNSGEYDKWTFTFTDILTDQIIDNIKEVQFAFQYGLGDVYYKDPLLNKKTNRPYGYKEDGALLDPDDKATFDARTWNFNGDFTFEKLVQNVFQWALPEAYRDTLYVKNGTGPSGDWVSFSKKMYWTNFHKDRLNWVGPLEIKYEAVEGGPLIRSTSSIDGYHVEYDSQGKPIGIYDKDGNPVTGFDLSFGSDGTPFIIDKSTGLTPTDNGNYTPDTNPNWWDWITKIWDDIKKFLSSGVNLIITIGVIALIIVAIYFVLRFIGAAKDATK